MTLSGYGTRDRDYHLGTEGILKEDKLCKRIWFYKHMNLFIYATHDRSVSSFAEFLGSTETFFRPLSKRSYESSSYEKHNSPVLRIYRQLLGRALSVLSVEYSLGRSGFNCLNVMTKFTSRTIYLFSRAIRFKWMPGNFTRGPCHHRQQLNNTTANIPLIRTTHANTVTNNNTSRIPHNTNKTPRPPPPPPVTITRSPVPSLSSVSLPTTILTKSL